MSDKQLLFAHFNKNLNMIPANPRVKVHPDRDDMVICPLCFNKFFTLDNFVDGSLTLDHVPPESLGGKGIVLTCKRCNNEQGTHLESFLVSHINDLNALQGRPNSFIDGTITTDLIEKVRINFQQNGKSFSIFPHKAAYLKEAERFTNQFANGQVGSLKLTLRMTNPRRAKLSLLRSAYLLAFAYMGYGFLNNDNLEIVRKQLDNPEIDLFPEQAIQYVSENEFPDTFLGINIIRNEHGEKSYYIIFDIKKIEKSYRAGVMLPGPNDSDYRVFQHIRGLTNQRIEYTITHYDVSFEDKLTYPFIAHDIWKAL